MIEILLATYNGAQWLPELLDSLLQQSDYNFSILARDDGSTDQTVRILTEFQRTYPSKLKLINDSHGNLGVVGNYNRLIEASNANYVMFCDQDDIWLPDKLKTTFQKILEVESAVGVSTPILVHTDLEVVNSDLEVIDPSFWHNQKLDPVKGNTLNRLLVQNCITGCTCMVNRALLNIAYPIPKEALMYDWWFALVAKCFGNISVIPEATIQYRQHLSNVLGSIHWGPAYIIQTILKEFRNNHIKKSIYNSSLQARYFLSVYENSLSEYQKKMINAWATICEAGCFAKRIRILRFRFLKTGWIRNLGFFFFM